MFYNIGSSNWTMKINDKTNKVATNDICRFAEKYHNYCSKLPNGYILTADFRDKDGDVVCFRVDKVGNIYTINHLVFKFKDGPRKMTNYINV